MYFSLSCDIMVNRSLQSSVIFRIAEKWMRQTDGNGPVRIFRVHNYYCEVLLS